MKTYWRYNGRLLIDGEVINGKRIGLVDNRYLDIGDTRISVDTIVPTGFDFVVVPTRVPFRKSTGLRLQTGDAAGDAVVGFIRNEYTALLLNGCFTTINENVDRKAVERDIEIRRDVSYWEYTNGLPRVDGKVKSVDGTMIPASESMWTGRVYRHVSEYKLDIFGMYRNVSRTENYVTHHDGRISVKSKAVLLEIGSHSGEYASPEDVTYIGGKCVLLTDLTSTYGAEGRFRRVLEVPEDYESVDGVFAHPDAVGICAGSGVRSLRHTMSYVGRSYYSEDFWRADGYHCDNCGDGFIRTAGESDCPSCRAGARGRIRNYSNKSAGFMTPEKDVPIKFGIELEVGCRYPHSQTDCALLLSDMIERAGVDPLGYCVYKRDSSIDECNGFEIVTRPDCPSVHRRVFGHMLKNDRVREHMSSFDTGVCGMHIHVSRAPLGGLWVGRMLVLINHKLMQPFIHTVAQRRGNRFTAYDDAKKMTSRNGNRYEALNTSGEETIEFRMFRGTLDRSSFLKNIEFVEAVLEYTRPSSRSLRDIGKPELLVKFISDSRKSYPELFTFLKKKGIVCH